jgi:integrase/recombinase XerD
MNRPDLHRHREAYLSVREALGFQRRAARTLLRDFVHYVENVQASGPIRAQLAGDWACAASSQRGASGAAQRLSMVRGFLAYLRATLPETEVPAHDVVASARRPAPYLLTTGQMQALMRAAHQTGPQGALRPPTLSTVIGLFASTGGRVGEALRLTLAAVHLESAPPFLHIRETQFHKSRLVPLHPSTATQLRSSLSLRATLGYDALADVVFVSEQGPMLSHKALGAWFVTLCRRLRLEPSPGGRRPSLQALRHRCAIERLRQWYGDGVDVQALVPTLSVSLGHLRPQESYWYRTATPELLTEAAARFQRYAMEGENR